MNKVGVGFASVSSLEKEYVMDCLENGRLSAGKYVARFEKEFAEAHGKRYGVMSNSGTAALRLAVEVFKEIDGWDHSTEILVPAVTFIATSNACLDAGMKVAFVDIDRETYNIDPNEIEKHITENTKCIIPVHTFGMPCDMTAVMEIAKKYRLRVIEDCAEAHFATVDGKVIGSFGDISTFSTYVAHTITTGIGGLSCTNERTHMEILRSLVAHGRACTCERCIASDATRTCPKRMETEIDRRFSFDRLGFSYRVGEIEGALGLAQLERKDEILNARHLNAEYLIKGLSKYEDVLQLPHHPYHVEHTYMMFPIVVKEGSGIKTRELVEYLEKNNVETRPMLPLLNQPIYKKLFGDIEGDYPNAKYINSHGFYIGCHHGLTMNDLNYTIEIIASFIENRADISHKSSEDHPFSTVKNWLSDEESLDLYESRIELATRDDYHLLQEYLDKYHPEYRGRRWLDLSKDLKDRISQYESVIVAGFGQRGRALTRMLLQEGVSVRCAIDNGESCFWGEEKLPVVKPEDAEFKEACVIVSPADDGTVEEICTQLCANGVEKERILRLNRYVGGGIISEEEQYFDPAVLQYEESEVFVDCGAFDLETSRRFVEECKNNTVKQMKVYAFEPDHKNYQVCNDKRSYFESEHVALTLIDKGAWSRNEQLHFSSNGGSSKVIEKAEQTIEAVSLDSVIHDKVTFIKMDIEGAELEALKGAKRLIQTYRPKLAICIYHKPEDLTEIPLYIKSLVPDYKLYIRHYSNHTGETVLYAV